MRNRHTQTPQSFRSSFLASLPFRPRSGRWPLMFRHNNSPQRLDNNLMNILQKLLFVAFLLVFPVAVNAQSYSIDWYKVSGGGGSSSNGQYSLSGTIGQHDAGGPMIGGNYALTGGFWAIYALQTPGAPTLYISRSGSTVTVYWQNVSGWNLQQNGNVTIPAGWSSSGGITTSNGTNYLNLPSPVGDLFFRLTNH